METETIRVLSFDPGLTKAGWTILDYNPSTKIVSIVKFGYLTPGPNADRAAFREEVNTFGKHVISLRMLREYVKELVEKYHPRYVATEGAFYNPRRPGAYGSLLQWIVTLENFLYDEYKLPVYRIAPKKAKHSISGNGDSGKISVQEAVLSHDDIVFPDMNQSLLEMCEHEADSMAIGYAFCMDTLPGLLNV